MYKVKRLVKTGEFNANGYKFEPESLKKALDKYIEEGGYLLKPYSDSYAKSLEERGEILPEYIIGKIDNYDDDYIYVKEVDKDFEDMVKAENTTCQLEILASDLINDADNRYICIIEKVNQIRLVV
jgi:hypothetical protein